MPQIPLTLSTTHFVLDAPVEAQIRRRVAQLERYYRPILHCQVFVEGPGRHHLTGGPYAVRLLVRVPGREIAVTHQDSPDLSAAIREAFDAARRQLEEHARRQRVDVKTHRPQPEGRIVRLFGKEGYGFDRLAVGAEVRFAEEKGDRGPQASTVEIVAEVPAEAFATA